MIGEAASLSFPARVSYFASWAASREALAMDQGVAVKREWVVGLKHPLLSLSIDDCVAAWGPDALVIWAWRPLDEATRALLRRRWFPHGELMQNRIYDHINQYQLDHVVHRFDFAETVADPHGTIDRLVQLTGMRPTPEQRLAALTFVTDPPRERLMWRDDLHWRRLALAQWVARWATRR